MHSESTNSMPTCSYVFGRPLFVASMQDHKSIGQQRRIEYQQQAFSKVTVRPFIGIVDWQASPTTCACYWCRERPFQGAGSLQACRKQCHKHQVSVSQGPGVLRLRDSLGLLGAASFPPGVLAAGVFGGLPGPCTCTAMHAQMLARKGNVRSPKSA